MEIGQIPQTYRYKNKRPNAAERRKLMRENRCFECRKVGHRSSQHRGEASQYRGRRCKKLNRPSQSLGTETETCIIADNSKKEKDKKEKKQQEKYENREKEIKDIKRTKKISTGPHKSLYILAVQRKEAFK